MKYPLDFHMYFLKPSQVQTSYFYNYGFHQEQFLEFWNFEKKEKSKKQMWTKRVPHFFFKGKE